MCICSSCTDLDHLELFCWDRTRITNVLEESLCYFNEGTSLVVYLFVLNLLLIILNGLMHETDGLD